LATGPPVVQISNLGLQAARTLAPMLRPVRAVSIYLSTIDNTARHGELSLGSPDKASGRRCAKPASPFVWWTLLAYLTLLGGTRMGDASGWLRPLNAAVALALILVWARRIPGDHDWMDVAMLAAVLTFLVSSVASMFPRQSFDASLQVLAAAAALWIARRHLARRLRRPHIETGMGWLAVGISAIVTVMWTLPLVQWAAASGWSTFPPLNLPHPTGQFGNQHDVAILGCLLVPAAWSPSFRERWPAAAWVASILTAIIVVLDGSRNVQLAVVLASALIILGRGKPRRIKWRSQRWRIAAGTAVLAILVVAAPPLLSRLANLTTAGSRFDLWADSVAVWLQHPVSGVGPGAFPFAFFLGDHFTQTAFDPRHPDNAVIQVVVEAGLLGVVAMAIVVASVLTAAVRTWRREPRASWALAVFAFACLGANPSDFVYLLSPAIVWVAILTPPGRLARADGVAAERHQLLRRLRYGLIALITVVITSASCASVLYEVARGEFARGHVGGAITALHAATVLDPSLSIYWREKASVELADGQLARAEEDYRKAISIVPYDPVSIRGLALTLAARGNMVAARDAAGLVAERHRLSAQNQLPLAVIAARMGDTETSNAALTRALLSEPQLAAAPWTFTILSTIDPRDAVQVTLSSVEAKRGVGTLEGIPMRAIGLLAPGADIGAIGGDLPDVQEGAAKALTALDECQFEGAWKIILVAESAEREYEGYWLTRALVASAVDGDSQRSRDLALIRFLGQAAPAGDIPNSLLVEYGDRWRYRREPIAPNAPATAMPSRAAGWSRLISEPEVVALSLGGSWPPTCHAA